MSWIRLHPYAAACAVAGLVLIAGALVVQSKTVARPGTLSVWGGNGAPLLNPTSYVPNAVLNEPTHSNTTGSNVAPIYLPPSKNTTSESGEDTSSYDLTELIAALTQPVLASGQKPSTSTIDLAYSFIPRGLIASNTPAPVLTETQQRLYNYGNDAASYIQTYEDSYRNAPISLRDQAEDRENEQKKQSVRLVAAGLRTVGESLLGMEDLPTEVKTTHTALAESYLEAGKRLSKVVDAGGDEAFIAAILSYNGAADTLATNYVHLATIFSLSSVRFSTNDPGSIFTFSGGGGL